MAESDNFCLRLNDFESDIKSSWKILQIEKDFCDVTLACEDKQIQTHKIIVSAFSPVLRNILKLNQNPLIYLKGVKYKDLQNLLNFMYQGEVIVAKEDLPSFLEVAEDLNIRGLSNGNTEGYNSKIEIAPQHTEEVTSNSKIKLAIEQINEPNSFETKAESKQACDDINDFESNSYMSIIESKKPKEENGEDNSKSFGYILEENKSTCEVCNKQFSSNSGLRQHVRSLHEGVRFPCNKCDYKATKEFHLKRHSESIHESTPQPNNQVTSTSTSKRKLAIENINEPNSVEADTEFEQEFVDFDDKESKGHISIIETQSKKPKQEMDEDKSQSFASLLEEKEFTCEFCDKHYTGSTGLHEHIRSIHKGVRFPCIKCDYKATKESHLKRHTEAIHEGVQYECDQCEYSASRKESLKKHVFKYHSEQQQQF